MFIVTGGGSGIGKALALALAERQQSVLVIGRREEPLIETAAQSPSITYLCADVSTQDGRQRILHHVKQYPALDGLVHNAGIIHPIMPMLEIDELAWQTLMATNVEAPLFLSQLLQDKLHNGRIMHVGSGAAHFPVVGWSAYCVSKASLSMLTRCWQLECSHIACANVMPGIIDTAMQEDIRDASHMATEKSNFFKQLYQNNQLVSPATVALFLCWLLLDVDRQAYVSKEWDIYDESHHAAWLVSPHCVPTWE